MVQTATVIIEKEEVRGPFKSKKTGKDFHVKAFVDSNGIDYQTFDTAMKIPFNVPVDMIFNATTNERNNKTYTQRMITAHKLADASSPPPKEVKPEPSFSKAPWETQTKQQLATQHIPVTTRDISMEVSGLLQSLISTGHFTPGVGESEIAFENLEGALRGALKLKHRVVSDLQSGPL